MLAPMEKVSVTLLPVWAASYNAVQRLSSPHRAKRKKAMPAPDAKVPVPACPGHNNMQAEADKFA